MTNKAREPRATNPAPAAPAAAHGEGEEEFRIPFEELTAAYEQQIGQLAGQLLQKDLVIARLQKALVEKSKGRPEQD